jgi:hypothetical protein
MKNHVAKHGSFGLDVWRIYCQIINVLDAPRPAWHDGGGDDDGEDGGDDDAIFLQQALI